MGLNIYLYNKTKNKKTRYLFVNTKDNIFITITYNDDMAIAISY